MTRVNSIEIDSTGSISDLCILGTGYGTDKSPYSYGSGKHRHPYTAVYDLLFSSKRYDPIMLGELGILDNMSMHMWRDFFPSAKLFGYDAFEERILSAKADDLYNTHYDLADVNSKKSMFDALNKAGGLFDILIDDSTHLFNDQIRFVEVALDFVKPGGVVIIEDIFRGWDNSRYVEALKASLPYFSSCTFLVTNHEHSYCDGTYEPYFDNAKLLVLFRNNVVRCQSNPHKEKNMEMLQAILSSELR